MDHQLFCSKLNKNFRNKKTAEKPRPTNQEQWFCGEIAFCEREENTKFVILLAAMRGFAPS